MIRGALDPRESETDTGVESLLIRMKHGIPAEPRSPTSLGSLMPPRCLDQASFLRTCAVAAMLSAVALPLSSSSAQAQYKQPILSIGFGGGAIIPVGKAQDDFKSGYTGQGFLLVHLGPLPAIRINLAFQKFDYKEALGIPDGHSNVFSGTGGLGSFAGFGDLGSAGSSGGGAAGTTAPVNADEPCVEDVLPGEPTDDGQGDADGVIPCALLQ